ncbi:uncharacterized protein LOC134684760 [Mytilus trossulus]|uniref:uncharacterized protein LOC134684760 n=1 Tax=Mytilus trossulus TaxID=6551 RepID=UPI0030069D9B
MLWRHGPSWIIDTTKRPVHTIEDNSVLSTLTDNVDVQQPTLENRTKGIHDLVEIERFSSYKKLLRTTAYVLRFIQNCRISKEDRTFGSCDVKEIQKSAQFWIRSCQILNYPEEYDTLVKGDRTKNLSRIRQLNLFLDQNNIIRCKGRIENAPIPESAKFPILLPANTQLTTLIVRDAHENLLHSGTSSVISHIRQNFWIPCIRQFVNKILRKCTACLKVNGTSYKAPDPPPLPKARLQDTPPFTVTGIDFTGALHVRDEHKNITKAYVCLFTCASTRGVHLEVLPNLSAECFMQAFRRFTSRRSTPKVVITDNALIFVAASKEIKQIIESQNVQSKIAELGVQWRFIPNRAPWYGGFWERLIAVTKTLLKKVLGKSLVDFQTLCTIVTEVESVMNDRPLTYTSTNINDSEPLTPSHLLCGRKIRSLSYPHSEQDNSEPVFMDYSSLTKQNERQRELFRHFWTRWKNDYVTSLREYHKAYGNNNEQIKVGDVVLVHDESTRINWKMVIVTELIRGNDGFVRAAKIKMKNTETTRPIVKQYPLEITCNSEKDDTCEQSTTQDIRPRRLASVKAGERIRNWLNLSSNRDDKERM